MNVKSLMSVLAGWNPDLEVHSRVNANWRDIRILGKIQGASIVNEKDGTPIVVLTHVRRETALDMIAAERRRQVEEKGYDAVHDDIYSESDSTFLAEAAAAYAVPPALREYGYNGDAPDNWPADEASWHPEPNDRIRELVKAGALIAAEIDRLRRVEAKDAAVETTDTLFTGPNFDRHGEYINEEE